MLSLSVDVNLLRDSPHFCISKVEGNESTPGIDPVSPQHFTAGQILNVGSPKSLDYFIAQLSFFMPWTPIIFFGSGW